VDLDPTASRVVNGVTDPAAQVGERASLLAFLQRQRDLVAWKLTGVDDGALRAQSTPSGLTAHGVVQHLEEVERSWLRAVFAGEQGLTFAWSEQDPDAAFRVPPDVTVEQLLRSYAQECRRCDEVVAAADLDQVSATRGASLRWILLHLVEETARHVGHLDLLRERADGATGEDPF
jgi:uncharacterized damage-inducible protein DinB